MKRVFPFVLMLACLCLAGGAEETPFQGWVYFEEGDPSPYIQTITDRAALDEFRGRIPEYRPTKKKPAPTNDDPLRTREIDLGEQTLVVVSRNHTISAYPEFVGQEEADAETLLKFRLPEPPPEARPYGWGTYRALLVPSGKQYRVVIVD